jgi:hypothetical protein
VKRLLTRCAIFAQTAAPITYDDPDAVPARAHIQVADRIGWMERAHELPQFERYPPRS